MSLTTPRYDQDRKENANSRHFQEKPNLWKCFIILSIVINYFLASLFYIFPDFSSDEIFFTVLILDVLYIVNYAAGVVNVFWTKSKLFFNFQSTQNHLVLIIDFFLAFPFSYIYKIFSGNSCNYNTFLYLRLVAFLRLFHLILFFKQLTLAGINRIRYFTVQFLMSLILILHSMTCIFCFVNFTKSAESVSEKYFNSLYSSISTITNRHFGDLIPKTPTQKLLSIGFICVGFFTTTIIFIAMLAFLLDSVYRKRTELKMELAKVLEFLQSINATENNVKLIQKYYKMLWTKKKGVYRSSHFALLPSPLKHEISVDITIPFLQTCTLFKDKSDAFLRRVSTLIKFEFYQSEELIYRKNVAKNKMIFVVVGTIEILSNEDDESPILSLTSGTCLGESSLILTLPAKSSVRTSSYTELQVLYRKDFLNLIEFFNGEYSSIRDLIIERIANVQSEEIPETEEIELSALFPKQNKSITENVKANLKKPISKIDKNNQFLALYRLKQSPTVTKVYFLKKFPWILHPENPILRIWNLCITFIAIFVAITYPYYIAFVKKFPVWFIITSHFVDLFLTLDVFIILITAIENNDRIVTSFNEISQKRLTQFGFYLDFVSCVKLELFYSIWTKNQRFGDLLQLNRLIKIYKIPKLIYIIENQIKYNSSFLYFFKYLFYFVIMTYWFGSFFYLFTCFEELCIEDGWFFIKLLNKLKDPISDFYTKSELCTSLYFALSCLSGLTFGDLRSSNLTDLTLTSLVLLFGVFSLNCCVAQLSALIAQKCKIQSDFENKLSVVLRFLKKRKISKELIQRIRNFFIIQWSNDKDLTLKNEEIFYKSCDNIEAQITIEEKMMLIASVPLFEGQNLDFLLNLARRSRTLILPPDEFVIYKGETLKIFYIIEKGYCLRQFEKSVVAIGPQSFFGTMCVFFNVNALCSVRTLTHVKLLYFTEEDFWKCAFLYPGVVTQFKETTRSFDILSEFNKIPIFPSILEMSEFDDSDFEGSFLYIINYCKDRDENYHESFQELGILFWLQIFLIPVCVFPYGSFLKLWMMIRLFTSVVTAVLTPVSIIQAPEAANIDKLLFAMDVIAYIDLYIMLHVGYFEEKNQLVLHPLKTAKHYLKGRFIVDFVLCFPWEIIFSHFDDSTGNTKNLFSDMGNVVRIVRMGQIYRMFQFFNNTTFNNGKFQCQIIKYVSMALILIHLWAAILIANSCKLKNNLMICNEGSWIQRSKFGNFSQPHEVYIVSAYFSTQLLTLSGLGDVVPQHLSTLIIVIIIIGFAVLFVAYIYIKMASFEAYWFHLQFQEQEKIVEMKLYMAEEAVNEKLQKQVIERLEYQWKRNQGVQLDKILTKTHPVLCQDTMYTMYENTLKKVPYFENLERGFLRIFGRLIREKCYLRKEKILSVDDIVSDFWIIERGVVRIISKSGTMEAFVEAGGIFGNLTRAKHHKILVSVAALSNVDVLVMNSREFYAALENYPTIKNVIERNWSRRTDFILPNYKSSDISIDSSSYPETSVSLSTIPSLLELKANFLTLFLMCLPWKFFRVSIPQFSALLKLFELYCLILTYLCSIFVIYEFCFQNHTSWLLFFAIYSDITFIIKIFLEMHRTYENRYGEIVTSNKKILLRYFETQKWKRVIDFTINLPFYYFVFLSSALSLFEIYQLFSTLRLITLFRLVYILDYYQKKSEQLMMNRLGLKISMIVIFITLIIHTLAGAWYLCACPLIHCYQKSWITEAFSTSEVKNLDKMGVYITSVYFVVNLLTKTATGDICATNMQELIFIILVMILSIFLIGILIGEVWNLLDSAAAAYVKYEYNIKELKQYVVNNKITKFQLKKLWKYVQQLWIDSRGNQVPQAILLLHVATVQELMLEIYSDHLKKSYIFSDIEDTLLRQLCQHLKRVVFFPGYYIVQHGDYDNTMYFIHSGEVEILSIHPNLTETVHEVLHQGDMFGVVQGLYRNVPHHFSFRARTKVHIVSLQLNEWEYLLSFFPDSKESIYGKTNRVNV